MWKNVKLQFLLVAGVSALLGYAAAYGKLNPFQKADGGQPEQPTAAAPTAAAAPGCCSDGLNKAGLVALASHNEAAADKAAAAGKKPNVVYFLVDNLGYGELGCYGGGVLRGTKTPRIDKFAAQGMKLLNFAPESQCTPSRSALMTGRYSLRSGNYEVPIGGAPGGLVAWEKTIADILSPAGYATSIVGKWHIGDSAGRRITASTRGMASRTATTSASGRRTRCTTPSATANRTSWKDAKGARSRNWSN